MSSGNVAVPTQFLQTGEQTYAYRRFGAGSAPPLLLLQHFMGTLDNWDPAVTDPLALGREVILFANAGIGRSTGTVAESIAGMAQHVLKFLNGLDLSTCDVLGFSLGGMIAQQIAQARPSGHGSLFQFHESFTRQATAFLASDSECAPY
jgi:pimeloyl-ACP methyl ester carboxylesterase